METRDNREPNKPAAPNDEERGQPHVPSRTFLAGSSSSVSIALGANAGWIKMKHKADPFSAVLTLVLTLLIPISLSACAAGSKPPQSSTALDKAKKIEISTVKFEGLPLAVVITMLHDEAVRRDAALKSITISLGPAAKQLADAEINLELRDVTLAETLGRVADSVGLRVHATDTEILLVWKNAEK